MAWPSVRAKTFTTSAVPADFNAVQDQYVRASGIGADDLSATSVAAQLGISQTGSVRRGKLLTATSQTTTSATYTTLTTPDTVASLVVAANSIIHVGFFALVKISSGTGTATIQVSDVAVNDPLHSTAALECAFTSTVFQDMYTTFNDVTMAGVNNKYGATMKVGAHTLDIAAPSTPCAMFSMLPIFIKTAGTYDVKVKFKSSSGGTVTVKDRYLYVKTEHFTGALP